MLKFLVDVLLAVMACSSAGDAGCVTSCPIPEAALHGADCDDCCPASCEVPEDCRILWCERTGDQCVGCAVRSDGTCFRFVCTPDGCEILEECGPCGPCEAPAPPPKTVAL